MRLGHVGKRRIAFIIAVVAMALCALVAAAGAIIYFAEATATIVLPLTLFLAGLAGVTVFMCVAFAVIPKNGAVPPKTEDPQLPTEDKKNDKQ